MIGIASTILILLFPHKILAHGNRVLHYIRRTIIVCPKPVDLLSSLHGERLLPADPVNEQHGDDGARELGERRPDHLHVVVLLEAPEEERVKRENVSVSRTITRPATFILN